MPHMDSPGAWPSLLISAEGLARLPGGPTTDARGDSSVVVVDCRFNLLAPDAGRAAWLQGHIPGAFYADLDRDLASPRRPGTGRHPLPEPDRLRTLFSGFGIGRGTRVVAYDEGGGAIAARLWWLLRWMGHRQVVLLDGGFAAWQAAGLPVSSASPALMRGHFAGEPGHMPVRSVAQVSAGLAGDAIRLLDVRAEARFSWSHRADRSGRGTFARSHQCTFRGQPDG